MEKIFSFLFFGALFGIIPLILLYGGIFVHYFAFYDIKEYFNYFFTYNLNYILYALVSIFAGLTFVLNFNTLKIIYLVICIAFSLALIPTFGKEFGNRIFKHNVNTTLNGEARIITIIYKDKHKLYYQDIKSNEPNKVHMLPLIKQSPKLN